MAWWHLCARCLEAIPARSRPLLSLGVMCTNSIRTLCVSYITIYNVAYSIDECRAVNVATVAFDSVTFSAEKRVPKAALFAIVVGFAPSVTVV